MAITKNLFLLSVLFLAYSFTNANEDAYSYEPETYSNYYPNQYSAPPKKATVAVVEGMVYCQSCKYSGSWSLDEAKPIGGATISVTCRNHKDRISYYKAYTTSEGGYFYAELNGFTMRHQLLDHPLQACVVKLVSSPIDDCDVFTNINYGVNGAKLRYDQKKIMRPDYEAVVYTAGPLAFRPEHCIPNQY